MDRRHDDPLPRLPRHIAGEVLVGDEDDGVALEGGDDARRIPRGAADIGLRLHVGVGVDVGDDGDAWEAGLDRKSTRLNSSHVAISYAVFCLKKKNNKK